MNKNTQDILNYQTWNRKDNIVQKMKLIDVQSPILTGSPSNTMQQLSTTSIGTSIKDSSKNLSPKRWFQTRKKLSKQFSQSIATNKYQKAQLNQFLQYLKHEFEKHIEQDEKNYLKALKQLLEQGKVLEENIINDLILNHRIDLYSQFVIKSKEFLLQTKQANKFNNKNTSITEENELETELNEGQNNSDSVWKRGQTENIYQHLKNNNLQNTMRYKSQGRQLSKINSGLNDLQNDPQKQISKTQNNKGSELVYFDPVITPYTINTSSRGKSQQDRHNVRLKSYC